MSTSFFGGNNVRSVKTTANAACGYYFWNGLNWKTIHAKWQTELPFSSLKTLKYYCCTIHA